MGTYHGAPAVFRFNAVYNSSPITCYDDYAFYTSGGDYYRVLFADIKAAEDCIYVPFYTIHNDIIGKSLVRALTEKSTRRSHCFVMCDFIANFSTPRSMFKALIGRLR